MVRTKETPKHVSSTRQKRVTWNLPDPERGESSVAGNIVEEDVIDLIDEDDDDDDEEDDFDYQPPPSYHRNIKEDSFEIPDTKKVKQPRKIEKPVKFDYGSFNNVLEKCDFSIKICKEATHSLIYCLFGEISIPVKNFNNEFEIENSFWLYVSKQCDESAVYFEWLEDDSASPSGKKAKKNIVQKFKYFHITGNMDIDLWASLCKQRYFQIVYDKLEDNILSLKIYFLTSGFVKLNYAAEFNMGNKSLSNVLLHFYSIESCEKDGEKNYNHDIDAFYRSIKISHQDVNYSDIDVQHPNLIPQLRPYQKQAVKWMLHQERVEGNMDDKSKLHPLYVEIISLDNVVLYYNRVGNFFVKDKPLEVSSCPGGILADEMGLGKTVEVLACIVCHKRPNITAELPRIHTVVKTGSGNIEQSFKQEVNANISNDNDKGINADDDENLKPEAIEEGVNIFSDNENETKYRHSKRKVSRIVNYSLLDSVLDSDKEDSNFDPSLDLEEELEEMITDKENAEENTGRRSKRKISSVNYSQLILDDEYELGNESAKKKRRVSSPANKFDVEKEITECSILSAIEQVILDNSWDGVVKDYKKKGSHKEFRTFLKRRKKDPYYMMTLRERLNIDYENSIAKYCAAGAINRTSCKGFFDTIIKQKSCFECVCGNDKNSVAVSYMRKVQCSLCSLWQHADCVQFESNDVNSEEYICPHCWTTQPPVMSGATLIVTPSSISYQWVDEISKHIKEKSLKVFVYQGVSNSGYIQPRTLACYDMVITSHETLGKEVNYVDLPHSNSEDGRRFRLPKRYMATPSPLPCVEWWRVCLDEAQMVECTTTNTAEMALRLSAVNRWCITGTPIQKSVNDLQGLLMFLGVDPYYVPQWWQRCLYDPYCFGEFAPLQNVMVKYMWRNSKLDVIHELDLPPQEEKIHCLKFTPVEEHFYKRLHSDCASEALKRINKFPSKEVKLSSLDKQSFSSLLQPLLKLRQACDHPQIVRGHFTSLNRKTLTMEQLLDNLLKKTQFEAEDTHRIFVAALNGLAALDIIQGNFVNAVEKYREVLRSVEEHKENFKTDSLQQLHTLHNLHEIIEANHEGVHPTLRDGTLNEEAKNIRDKYLKLYPQRIAEAELECSQNTNAIEEQKEKYNYKSEWWISALESLNQEFVQEVKGELQSQYSRFDVRKCILNPIQNKVQLMQLLRAKLRMLNNQRIRMISDVNELLRIDHDSILNGAIDCHLRPVDVNNDLCILCLKHELFEDYEENLFFMQETKHYRSTDRSKETKDVKEKLQMLETTRKGNWGQSEIERVLRYLQTKSLGRVDPRVYEDSQTHLVVLQGMKKEFKNFRILWRTIYDRVSALDEVNMAILRFRIRFPGEEVPNIQKKKKEPSEELEKKFDAPKYVLEESEIPQQEMKLKSEKIVSRNDLRLKLGQLFYLKNLKKVDFGKDGSSNPEPCPICQGKLGHRWKVLLCGHSFCMDCVAILMKRISNGSANGSLKCPICRQPTKMKEIAYVDMRSTEKEEAIKVTGSLSTKIEGVVRAMLKIKTLDPKAKVLIFSSWNEVLEVIADGLAQNGLTYRILNARKKFQENLSSFKRKQEITALLMLLSSGAKGLNLVEARYIILVEPILNPADEFQAIGRIHRIGQDKPTFIHRFIINGTIEERMFNILHPKYAENSVKDNPVTIEDLHQLFVQNGNEEPDATEEHESNEVEPL